jgi:HEPN domain-containing protein
MRSEARAWWELAEADQESARVNLAADRFYIAAFLSQQCVEKALKALWLHRRREMPPKTHNLLDLAQELSAYDQFETSLLRLNPLYVSTRYPDAANGAPSRNYNRELAEGLLRDAEEVMTWCRAELGQS